MKRRVSLGSRRFAAWVEDSGATRKSIAIALGVDYVTVWRLMSGVRMPTLEQALAIERLCKIDVKAWLVRA